VPLTVETIHEAHAERVWRNLHRMGVPEADLPDMLQEVFVVVHRRLHTFDGTAKVSTWLYGICRRVAASHRRRAHVRRERPTATVAEGVHQRTPEAAAIDLDRRRLLQELLDELDVERRAVLVMYELEELSCVAIAEQLGVPVGTVYSRLHQAREDLHRAWRRRRLRDEVRQSEKKEGGMTNEAWSVASS
jgi:RNA polymerase sigma-70 factor (ECF subfamily)